MILASSSRGQRRRLVLSSLVVIACGVTGLGRSIDFPGGAFAAVGTRAERGYFSVAPFDQIDMVNGSLKLSFVDLALPGNAGMDLRISRSCRASCTDWSFSFTHVPIRVLNPVNPSPEPWTPKLGMPDGTFRPLHANAVNGYFVTSDFWRYDAANRTLYLPNGWVATYEQTGNPTGGIMLVEVHDQFGNEIRPEWNETTARPWKPNKVTQKVSDAGGTREREVVFAYEGNNPKLPSTITYDGGTWTYAYATTAGNPLTSVTPPAGPSWGYAYQSGVGFEATVTVTTPSGGTVAYEIGAVSGLQDWQPVLVSLTTGGRAVTGDTWDFAYSYNDSDKETANSVTRPWS